MLKANDICLVQRPLDLDFRHQFLFCSTFGQCVFRYASTTNKSASAISSGICANSVVGNPNIVVLNSFFALAGTTNQSNFVIQDLGHGTALTAIKLHFGNSSSLGNAQNIQGTNNTTKFLLNTVS